jgi:hypothetical protein
MAVVGWMAVVGVAGSLAGCGTVPSTVSQTQPRLASPPTSPTAAPTTVRAPGAAAPVPPVVSPGRRARTVSTPAFRAARDQWEGESAVIASDAQNSALQLAVDDLEAGLARAGRNRSADAAAIAALSNLEATPLAGAAGDTGTADSDLAALDEFFGPPTSGHASVLGVAAGPSFRAAAAAWRRALATTRRRPLAARSLRRAVADLRTGLRSDPGTTYAYPAAIADLSALAADLVVPHPDLRTETVQLQVAYLNAFFAPVP